MSGAAGRVSRAGKPNGDTYCRQGRNDPPSVLTSHVWSLHWDLGRRERTWSADATALSDGAHPNRRDTPSPGFGYRHHGVAGHACTECGATIERCNEHITQFGGEGCCVACFRGDTHGLLNRPQQAVDDLAQRVEKVETSLLADMVLLRTDLMEAVRVAGEMVGAQARRIEELEERLAHFDHAQAVVDYGLLDAAEGELEDRVQILEMCIEGIEKKLKLKRRQPPVE